MKFVMFVGVVVAVICSHAHSSIIPTVLGPVGPLLTHTIPVKFAADGSLAVEGSVLHALPSTVAIQAPTAAIAGPVAISAPTGITYPATAPVSIATANSAIGESGGHITIVTPEAIDISTNIAGISGTGEDIGDGSDDSSGDANSGAVGGSAVGSAVAAGAKGDVNGDVNGDADVVVGVGARIGADAGSGAEGGDGAGAGAGTVAGTTGGSAGGAAGNVGSAIDVNTLSSLSKSAVQTTHVGSVASADVSILTGQSHGSAISSTASASASTAAASSIASASTSSATSSASATSTAAIGSSTDILGNSIVTAPVAIAAPVIHIPEGTYVAKTRGTVHVAPRPGHWESAASVNLLPAPGTL